MNVLKGVAFRPGWTAAGALLGLACVSAVFAGASTVGAITAAVSTAASPVSTIVGGACCEPSAERTRDSTTAILEKLVSVTAAKGRRERRARAPIIETGSAA